MDTISIENLVFAGTHGVLKEEHEVSQRFSVSIKMHTDTTRASASDKLSDVVDYRGAREIVRGVIEGPHVFLIESLADTIARKILCDNRVQACSVTVKKLDLWGNGLPGIEIERTQKFPFSIDGERLVTDLAATGFSVQHLFDDELRYRMKTEADAVPMVAAEAAYGPMRVQQSFAYTRDFAADGLLWKIGRDLARSLRPVERYFSAPISFNEVTAQRYLPGELGISLHYDSKHFRNVVAICLVEGQAEFYTSDKREGGTERVVPLKPGDVVFMRAPGFMSKCFHGEVRPFHAVRNITSPRLTVTYRQEVVQS